MKTFLLTSLFLALSLVTLSQKDLDSVSKYFDSIYVSEVYPGNFKPKVDKKLSAVAKIQMDYLKGKKNMFLSHDHPERKYESIFLRFEETVNKNKKFENCYVYTSEVLCRIGNYDKMNNEEIAKYIFDAFMRSPSHKKAMSAYRNRFIFLFDYSVDNEIICAGVMANKFD